jgi:hypothetical protein
VLVEHRVDDVNEGLVAVEDAVAAGEQVALEPALAGVLREDLPNPIDAVERAGEGRLSISSSYFRRGS